MNNRNIRRFSLIQGAGHPQTQRLSINCSWKGANAILRPEKRSWAYFHRLAKTYDLYDLGFIMICWADGALLFLSETKTTSSSF